MKKSITTKQNRLDLFYHKVWQKKKKKSLAVLGSSFAYKLRITHLVFF